MDTASDGAGRPAVTGAPAEAPRTASGTDDAGSPSSIRPGGGAAAPGAPQCDPTPSWGTGSVVVASEANDDLIGAITPDELTVAWTEQGGGLITVSYADRASASSPFGALGEVPMALGPFAFDRVALSADGLRLVAVAAGGTGLVQITRSSRAASFGTLDSGSFATLTSAQGSGVTYASPLLSPDDQTFWYGASTEGGTPKIYVADRGPSGSWAPGTSLPTPQFFGSGQGAMQPSGLSADGLSLFYWDGAAQTEMVAWRATTTSPFNWFVDVGPARKFAQPNASCDSIYWSGNPLDGGSSMALWVSASR